MLIIFMVESTTIVSSITTFEPALIPMFSILIFSKILNPSHCSPSFPPLLLLSLFTTIRDGKSKHEKQLMIADGEGEFNQDVLVFGNQFRIEYV
jgi:hypothetical protein